MRIEDFSDVKKLFEQWRSLGVSDIRAFLRQDVGSVAECSQRIKILDGNTKTLEVFEAANVEELRANASNIFRDDMMDTHINELSQLFIGEALFSSTTVDYTL